MGMRANIFLTPFFLLPPSLFASRQRKKARARSSSRSRDRLPGAALGSKARKVRGRRETKEKKKAPTQKQVITLCGRTPLPNGRSSIFKLARLNYHPTRIHSPRAQEEGANRYHVLDPRKREPTAWHRVASFSGTHRPWLTGHSFRSPPPISRSRSRSTPRNCTSLAAPACLSSCTAVALSSCDLAARLLGRRWIGRHLSLCA